MSKPILTFPCKYQPGDLEKRSDSHFCLSCDHSVIDFRNASEAEINSTLATSDKKTCGIFNLNQVTQKTTVIPLGIQRRIGLSLFGILGLISPVVTSSCETTNNKHEIEKLFSNLKLPLFLRGRVIDEQTKKPLAHASIQLIQDSRVVLTGITNDSGEFVFALKEHNLSSPDFDLLLESFGYISENVHNPEEWDKKPLEIALELVPNISVEPYELTEFMMGDYVIVSGSVMPAPISIDTPFQIRPLNWVEKMVNEVNTPPCQNL